VNVAVRAGTALLAVQVTGSRNVGAELEDGAVCPVAGVEPPFTRVAFTEGTIVMLFAGALVVRVTTDEPGSGASLNHPALVFGASVSVAVEKLPFVPGMDAFLIDAPLVRNANPYCCCPGGMVM
jgi:hypothetical protein